MCSGLQTKTSCLAAACYRIVNISGRHRHVHLESVRKRMLTVECVTLRCSITLIVALNPTQLHVKGHEHYALSRCMLPVLVKKATLLYIHHSFIHSYVARQAQVHPSLQRFCCCKSSTQLFVWTVQKVPSAMPRRRHALRS